MNWNMRRERDFTISRWLNDPRLWICAADEWGYEGDYCLAVVDDFGGLQPVALIPLRSRSSKLAEMAARFKERAAHNDHADRFVVKW